MAPRINIPPITRALLILLITFSLLNAFARYHAWQENNKSSSLIDRQHVAPYLTLVPGASLPKYLWVLLTATLVEQNIAGLLITGASLFYGGRYLERAWSSNEYFKFVGIAAVVPNVLSWLIYITIHLVTGNEGASSTAISGGIAIQGGFLVAFKQLVPEHTVNVANGIIKMRVKHFPAIFLLLNTISGIVIGTDTAMLLAWIGFLASWTYLRFYRTSPVVDSASTGDSSSIKGDASDTFSFAAFWPDVVQPYIEVAADVVYKMLVSFKILSPFSTEDVETGNMQASARSGGEVLPSLLNRPSGGRRDEAERRRALALRALDQRLQATSTVKAPAAVVNLTGPSPLGETTYEPDEPNRPGQT